MAEKERSDIIIEGNTASWEMKVDGEINGTHMGTFRFRCFLTPTQQIAANREMRELLGANMTMAPEHETFLAYALTQLKYRIVQAPPFWSASLQNSPLSGDVPDENVITEVLQAAVDAEVKYKLQLKKRKDDAIQRAKEAAERMLKIQDDKPEEDKESEE